MTEDQHELIEKAAQSVAAAETLLNDGFSDFAASRAYYAMFYVAEAFLEGLEMSFSKHSAVIAAFGRFFVQPNKVEKEYQGFLVEASQMRNRGDYGGIDEVTIEEARTQIDHAKQFLNLAEKFL